MISNILNWINWGGSVAIWTRTVQILRRIIDTNPIYFYTPEISIFVPYNDDNARNIEIFNFPINLTLSGYHYH